MSGDLYEQISTPTEESEDNTMLELMSDSEALNQRNTTEQQNEPPKVKVQKFEGGQIGPRYVTNYINVRHRKAVPSALYNDDIDTNRSKQKRKHKNIDNSIIPYVLSTKLVYVAGILALTIIFLSWCIYLYIVPPEIRDTDFLRNVQALKEKYQNSHSYQPFNLWYNSNSDIPLKKYIFQLKVIEDKMLENSKRDENILLEDALYLVQSVHKTKHSILITGNPYFGKSSLIRKIACMWSINCASHYLSSYDLVVVISLRDLNSRTIPEMIVETIFGNKDKRLIDGFRKSHLNFFILLDGYEEMKQKGVLLDFMNSYLNSLNITILLTSTIKAATNIKGRFDWHFSLVGLSKENQKKYIDSTLTDDLERKEKLKTDLDHIMFLPQLMKCPLMMNIFCYHYLYLHSDIDITITTLYIQMFNTLIQKFWTKYGYSSILKRGTFLKGEVILTRLGELAFRNLNNSRNFIPIEDIMKEFQNEEEYEIVSNLNIIPLTIQSDDTAMSPFHHYLLEFLSVFHIFYLEYKKRGNSGFIYGNTVIKKYLILRQRNNFIYGMKTYWDFDRLERDFMMISEIKKVIQFPGEMEMFHLCRKKITEERFKAFCLLRNNYSFNIIWDSIATLKDILRYGKPTLLTIIVPPNIKKWDYIENDMLKIINSSESITHVFFRSSVCPYYIDEYKNLFLDLRSLFEASISAVNTSAELVIDMFESFDSFNKISRNFLSDGIYREEEIVSLVYFGLREDNKPPFKIDMERLRIQFPETFDLEIVQQMILFISENQIGIFNKYPSWKNLLNSYFNWEINPPKHYKLQLNGDEIVSIL
ncbi:uncharacterized protein LOC111623926 isoform X1 [Centruroides sculpturatus]|uniref:uncharacterized protein LOC111623926 isoform X1 n=2 Tax=Centruroides sculpturatus TaxID=218467 RepID=UPI000C6E2F35|nr:uncharacterized protein LOC111623926 isoform X1 [Centruroides sculpturatus]XP_023222438.1 uncharacterized protein LOC111623926 isoform X1 [Centruroides sculpturatus]